MKTSSVPAFRGGRTVQIELLNFSGIKHASKNLMIKIHLQTLPGHSGAKIIFLCRGLKYLKSTFLCFSIISLMDNTSGCNLMQDSPL